VTWSDAGLATTPVEFVNGRDDERIRASGTWRYDGSGALRVTATHVFLETLASALEQAGFRGVEVRRVDSPVRLPSAAECARFERESFGALHQMMAALSESERAETWKEIKTVLRTYETEDGFVGPCEMLVGAGTK